MGACYDARVKIAIKKGKENNAVSTLRSYIEKHDGHGIIFNLDKFASEGTTPDTLEGLLKIFLCGTDYWNPVIKHGRKWLHYYNGFDASYGWESVMMEMFEVLAPFLENKSEMYIYPDEDYDHIVVKNGRCVQEH